MNLTDDEMQEAWADFAINHVIETDGKIYVRTNLGPLHDYHHHELYTNWFEEMEERWGYDS